MMYQELDKVEQEVGLVEINTTATHEPIGEIEWNIHVIKEPSGAIISTLPFMVLLKQVVIHLIYFAILWMNILCNVLGISDCYSPHEIVTSPELDFEKHCKG